DAGGQVLAEKIRLSEAEVQLRARTGDDEIQSQILPAAEQIALAYADVADRPVGGGEAGTEREFARRLLLDVDLDDGPIRAAALQRLQIDLAEEAEILNPLTRAPDLGGIEGIALDDAELAPDHFVESPDVAVDVDALDIDARALLDVIGERDGELL